MRWEQPTAAGLFDCELSALLVKAHVEQGVEIGRHVGGEWWCKV